MFKKNKDESRRGVRPVVFMEHDGNQTNEQRLAVANGMREALRGTVLGDAKVMATSNGWRVTNVET